MRLLVKPITLIVVCLAILIGCETEKEVIDLEQLQSRQGIFTKSIRLNRIPDGVNGMKTAKNEWKAMARAAGLDRWERGKNGPQNICRW